MASRARVAVLRTTPATVLDDYDRLLSLAGVEAYLPADSTVILKDNISWHYPFPSANTTPWQLEGTIVGLRRRGYDKLVCVQNKTVVTNAFKHGRPVEGTLQVNVALRHEGDHMVLTVRDNGRGVEANFAAGPGFGMKLVKSLAVQLDAAIEFFGELGLELEGRAWIEGEWAGRVTGLGDQRVEIAMLRTPDGHGRLELSRFVAPEVVADHRLAPVNALGYLRVMFAVDDIDDTLARLAEHGAQLVSDEVVRYEDAYRLCYVRGPEGILLGLAEELQPG